MCIKRCYGNEVKEDEKEGASSKVRGSMAFERWWFSYQGLSFFVR
jgi:hypothetical protein